MCGMSQPRKVSAGSATDQTISNTIRAIVAYHHVNVTRLALATGLSRSGFYNRLSGETSWSAAEVKRAADALNVSVATLYDGLAVAGAGFEPATSGLPIALADVVHLYPLDGLTQADFELTA
jgi:hypothetical protein